MRLVYLFFPPVLLAGFTLSAFAVPITGQISIGGYAQAVGSTGFGSATGISFANGNGTSVSGTSGVLSSYGAGSGSFAALGACSTGSCGTIKDISSFATETPTSNFLVFTTGSTVVDFDLISLAPVTRDPATNSLTLTALGTIDYTGFISTPGVLSIIARGDNITNFSGTLIATPAAPAVTPEPSSLVLLAGPMLLCALREARIRAGCTSCRTGARH